MFVQNLNSQQQSALLFLAKEVARADKSLDEIEFKILEILKAQSNPDVEELVVQQNELASLFVTEREKCSLILELLGIAHANEEYHLNEKDLITSYAKTLNLSTEKLASLEKWVEKQLVLSKEVEILLG